MSEWDGIQFDAHGNLVDVTRPLEPGPPADLTWTRLELFALTSPIVGQGVAISDDRGVEHNLIVTSELFTDDAGTWVRVMPYMAYVEWTRLPDDSRPAVPARTRAVAARSVWVIHEKPAASNNVR